MGVRESLQKLADKKDSEIIDLRLQLAQAEAYLQAIQDSMKVLPKESLMPDLGRNCDQDDAGAGQKYFASRR